jgi:butyryl-CoA dehydrogenase
MAKMQTVLGHLVKFAGTDVDRYLSDASVFMEQAGYVVIAWQWLKMAITAQEKLAKGQFEAAPKSFYEGKVHTMKFFFRYELPHADACAATMMDPAYLTGLTQYDMLR